jgi:hypothetical protein
LEEWIAVTLMLCAGRSEAVVHSAHKALILPDPVVGGRHGSEVVQVTGDQSVDELGDSRSA